MEKSSVMSNRTTSAGYRFPIASRPKSSDFHKTCVPAIDRERAARAPATIHGKKQSDGDFEKCDAVKQDDIWKQCVQTEKRGAKEWEENWGFMTELDQKGRPKTAQDLPEDVNMFSGEVPNTNSGNYGSRLDTDLGQAMQTLEFKFNAGNRKKKLGNDLVCY